MATTTTNRWRRWFTSFLVLAIIWTHRAWAKIDYNGYQLFNVTVDNDEQLAYLRSLENEKGGEIRVRFFHSPMRNRAIDVLAAPESVEGFRKELAARRVRYGIKYNDFQKAIDDEQAGGGRREQQEPTSVRAFKDSSAPSLNLVTSRYLKLNEIDTYLAGLINEYPDLVQLENIGTTYENRPLTVVKVGAKNGENNNAGSKKPVFWIDSGIHSREWIAPAVGLYILNKVVTESQRNSSFRPYVDNLTWYFLPVMNPDGYEYTYTHDRMWRKNRRRSATGRCKSSWFDENCCEGVDLNRNFGYQFGGVGSSADPCDEIYRGPSAFSEPESKAVRDYILKNKDTIKGFITMHSFSQMWFYPYGDRKRYYPSDKDDLHSLAERATNALASVYGTRYKVGTAADMLYESTGGSDDWAKSSANIKYVYGVELRPSDDDSRYGFILPASYIRPTGEETWAAVRTVADQLITSFGAANAGGATAATDEQEQEEESTLINPNPNPLPFSRPTTPSDKSTGCWWFRSSGYCNTNYIRQLCPVACGAF